MNNSNLYRLEIILDYKFNNLKLLDEAVTHSSKKIKKNSNLKYNYERLEFIGDRILGFIISKKAFLEFPKYSEGELNSIFQKYTNENFLYEVSLKMKISNFIKTQKGDDLKKNKSILADVIESIIGAIYIDSNLKNCEKIVNKFIL